MVWSERVLVCVVIRKQVTDSVLALESKLAIHEMRQEVWLVSRGNFLVWFRSRLFMCALRMFWMERDDLLKI